MATHLNVDIPIASYQVADMIAAIRTPFGVLRNDCVAVCDVDAASIYEIPNRLDAFVVGVCTAGEARVMINLQEYTLRKNTLFSVAPNHLCQLYEAYDFKAHVLIISSKFFSQINVDTKQLMPLSIELQRSALHIAEENTQMLCSYIALIEREMRAEHHAFTDDLVPTLIAATLYKVGETLLRQIKTSPMMGLPKNRAEAYFQSFVHLLGQHYLKERSVSYYADLLDITPKYLTTLIKRVSGRSVSDWIDYYVIVEAKTLLKFSDKSIMEISDQLNFANQSFFGSYFRRNTGMSPSQYRALR